MGVAVGDEVDITMIDRTLVVRPVEEKERSQRLADAVNAVFLQRRELMRRLAEGPEPGVVSSEDRKK
jgi:virulence-associated protein VagC